MDEWDWHRTIDLNLTAAFLCMQSVGRVMRELGGGVIVNVIAKDVQRPTHSSQQATPQGRLSNVKKPESSAYEVAAAGVEALSRAAEEEFAAHKIRVQVARSASEVLKIVGLT
jgi:NAD(P)-dependent dehydrogenase (short-subunit alcohol dehydrogenase family)